MSIGLVTEGITVCVFHQGLFRALWCF